MFREKQIDQAEVELYDQKLIDQLARLEKWWGEIHERCEDPARMNDDPLLLKWYAGKLHLIIQLQVQITIEQDFEGFTDAERKKTLRKWIIEDPKRIEYKKACLYLQQMTIEKARDEISQIRASIDERAEEIATAISAVFGYTEHFEFWPMLSTGKKARSRKSALSAASGQKPGQDAGAKTSHGRFQDLIEACILRLQARGIKVNYKNVAAIIVISDDPRSFEFLPPDYQERIKKTQFAGNLRDFIEQAEKNGSPIDFRQRFTNMFYLVRRRRAESLKALGQ